MAVTTQGRRQVHVRPQPQYVPTTQSRRQTQSLPKTQTKKKEQDSGLLITSGLKASLVGGFGFLILMLISLIRPPDALPIFSLAILVIPGFLVVCLSTGLLAAIFAGDNVKNSHQGGKVGWMAGFWAGVFGAILAMALAAMGWLMFPIGQGVVNQFTPEQLAAWNAYVTADTIALAGRVFGALIIYGVVGSLVAALISSIGGMIYPKLSNN